MPLALFFVLLANLLINFWRACDYLLAPGFRKKVVEPPVFVLATPRSGTTFLHHLLALDEEVFTHQRLYQTIFTSVAFDRVIRSIGAIERFTRLPFSWFVRALNRRMFPHWDGIHSVGLDAEEEDEAIFVASMATPSLYLLMPDVREAPEYQYLKDLGPKVQSKLVRDYRLTVQRHLHSVESSNSANSRSLVIKNVFLPSRMEMTQEAFPESRFIRLVRDPRSAIPSAISLFYTTWKVHSPQIEENSPETRALGQMFIEHYRRLYEESRGPRAAQFLTVRFEDLVADPLATVRQIYAFLGKDLSATQQERLAAACSKPQSFKSKHKYSLEDYGFSEEELREQLGDIMQEHGYLKA